MAGLGGTDGLSFRISALSLAWSDSGPAKRQMVSCSDKEIFSW